MVTNNEEINYRQVMFNLKKGRSYHYACNGIIKLTGWQNGWQIFQCQRCKKEFKKKGRFSAKKEKV